MTIIDFIAERLQEAQPSVDRVRASLEANPLGRHAAPYADAQVMQFDSMWQTLDDARARGYPSDHGHDEMVRALASRWVRHRGYDGATRVAENDC